MKKLIEIEFDDDFVPPERFRGDTSLCDINPCAACPFFRWDDEYGEGWCSLGAETGCPIKKYFDSTNEVE